MLDAIFPIPASVFVGALAAAIMANVILSTIPLYIYFERKISAYIQDRLGPNRVGFDFGLPWLRDSVFRRFGFWGLGQSAADGLKFLLKEDYMPRGADKWLFTIAPMASVIPAFIGWAVIPWGGYVDVGAVSIGEQAIVEAGRALVSVADVNVGFVYLIAVASLGVYGITLGGWASNNKYSFLGGLRASAGMISYEIPLGLAVLAMILVTGSVRPSAFVEYQAHNGWLFLSQPLALILFFTCILAEANRAPFDNAEAEQELVGGYHTEYSAMRFALFFLAEYAHMVTSSAFCILLFFGGYHLPFIGLTSPEATGLLAVVAKVSVFYSKVVLTICFMMLVRWTLPRIRYDQVLKLAWQSLIPIGMVLVVSVSIMVFMRWNAPWQMLILNIGLIAVMMWVAPFLPRADVNRRVPMAGSRFCPLPGEAVSTAPIDPVARDDHGLPRDEERLVSVN